MRNTGGHPDELKHWRQELTEGKRLGPRLVACGPVVDGPPPIHPDHSVVVETDAQARSTVDGLKAQGWDFIKVYDNVPRGAYFGIAAEAKKDAIPFVGHVPVPRQNVIAMHSAKKAAQRSESWPFVLCLGLGAVMSSGCLRAGADRVAVLEVRERQAEAAIDYAARRS